MNQNDLNRAVARATGETVACVRRMGFCLKVVPTAASASRRGKRRSRPGRGQRRPATASRPTADF